MVTRRRRERTVVFAPRSYGVSPAMVIDVHVHVSAATPGHGWMSRRVVENVPFRFMRGRLGLAPYGPATEALLERKLTETIDGAQMLDAVVVLAFDAVYTPDGVLDKKNTHLYVTNDYVIELCQRHPKMLFGASVNPYRKDAVREVERCVAAGAVLLKWLPLVQDFDPADDRCLPFYDALAHHRLPLLSHTGGEKSLPNLKLETADPARLQSALRRGVTVIAAHCGARSAPGETDYLPTFMRMAREHERLYGDTAAMNLPNRSYAFPRLLADPAVRSKLLHGSDWPIPSIPPVLQLRPCVTLAALRQRNGMHRDVLLKRSLGFDYDYLHRAATVLRLPR